MTPFLKSLQKATTGKYDSATGKDIRAFKAIDVTHLCTRSKQAVVKYGKAKRGIFAQIIDLSETEIDNDTSTHYFIGEWSVYLLSEDTTFLGFSYVMGFDPREMAYEIFFQLKT